MRIVITIVISFVCIVCAAQNVPLTRGDSVFMAQREKAKEREKQGPPPPSFYKIPVTITPQRDSIIVPVVKPTLPKVKYKKVVVLDLQDVNNFINTLERLKMLEMYNPQATDKQKVDNYRSIEEYLVKLRKRVVVDSVKVK